MLVLFINFILIDGIESIISLLVYFSFLNLFIFFFLMHALKPPTLPQPSNPPTFPQPTKSPSKSPSSSPSSSPTPQPTLPPTRSVSDGGRCRWLLCIFIVHRYIIFAHKICTISTFSLLSSSKCINSPRIVQVNLPHNSQLILQHNSQLVYVLRTQGQVC